MHPDTVKVNGVDYIMTSYGDDSITESLESGYTDPNLSISGEGYRADDEDETPVEIVWYLDKDLVKKYPDDSEMWRENWYVADEANPLY